MFLKHYAKEGASFRVTWSRTDLDQFHFRRSYLSSMQPSY